MTRVLKLAIVLALSGETALFADELLYRYEGDVLPQDPTAGWLVYDPCNQGCSEGLEPGHLVLTWGPFSPSGANRIVNYSYSFAEQPETAPTPPFWAEWRFASNFPVFDVPDYDGQFHVGYFAVGPTINMYGNAIFDFAGDRQVIGLALNEFRTFRLEATDQTDYCVWYDGKLFNCATGSNSNGWYLQMRGFGGDNPSFNWPLVNRWDFVRYGRSTSGEIIVGADPPSGSLDGAQYPDLDRFAVTFDQPNYVYVNDVAVEVVGNQYRDREGAVSDAGQSPGGQHPALALGAPIVIATRRQDNGPPETVEIVLDRPLTTADGTVRFTFNTGVATPQIVEYSLVHFEPCCLPGGQCQSLAPQDWVDQGGSTATGSCEGDLDHDGRDGACGDACPSDPGKLAPEQCGCGLADTDSDADTFPDCLDQCPGQDDRIDNDSDGTPDCLSPAIPTTTSWGLIVLTLVLLTTSKLLRSPATAPTV